MGFFGVTEDDLCLEFFGAVDDDARLGFFGVDAFVLLFARLEGHVDMFDCCSSCLLFAFRNECTCMSQKYVTN